MECAYNLLHNRKVHVKPKYCVSLSSIVDNYVLQINVLFVYVKLMEIKYKFICDAKSRTISR